MAITRYHLINGRMADVSDGRWCKLDDVQSELAALREKLADCERSNEILRNQTPSEIQRQRTAAIVQRNEEAEQLLHQASICMARWLTPTESPRNEIIKFLSESGASE